LVPRATCIPFFTWPSATWPISWPITASTSLSFIIVGSLSQSQLGDLGEKLVNSQFSQRQESEADDYS
jgi:Zn-dependent protease with chaperone function